MQHGVPKEEISGREKEVRISRTREMCLLKNLVFKRRCLMYKKATKGNGIESRTGNLAILAKMLDKEPTKSSCNKKEK